MLKVVLFLDNARTISEAFGQKAYRWEWRKMIPDRWWLSAVIAYGVIMHWAGYSRWCCLRPELSCTTRDDDFSNFSFAGMTFAVRFPYWRQACENASARGRWEQGAAVR